MPGGANVILATADGCGTFEVMRRSRKSKPVVWRWQERFNGRPIPGSSGADALFERGLQPDRPACAFREVSESLVGKLLKAPLGLAGNSFYRLPSLVVELQALAGHRSSRPPARA